MTDKMSEATRNRVISIASKAGFAAVLKPDGSDEYVKHIMLRSPGNRHCVFVRKVGITTGADGEPRYFQVAVHPEQYRPDLVDSAHGIEESMNRRTKQNLFPSSNYRGFPSYPNYESPCGKCYRAADLSALQHLMNGLAQ
jgi:hypothetical protein